ncbi:MAG: serine/threonine-protein kinase [Polyangiaceae bacterium]
MTSSRPTHALNLHVALGLSMRPDGPVERQLAVGTSIRPEILHIDGPIEIEQPRGETMRCPSTRAQPLVSYPPPTSAVGCYTGTTIDGRYRIEGVLGEGGMGVVYLGRHLAIDKKVAIKILRAEFARRSDTKARFRQEARAASSIENPHIVDVSDFGALHDGSTYLVMEYLEGQPLSSLTKDDKPVKLDRAIAISRQIADGLAEVHDRGIVHRDLKPDNVFLVKEGDQEDFVKILDFGIAKVLESADARVTCAGSLFGTPSYMSPEQAAGMPVDARTDIYALGIIMYELACGRVPFDADTLMGILTQHLYRKPSPLRDLLGETSVSSGLDAIITKALSKAPEQRYQNMRELSADLAAVAEGRTPEAVIEMAFRRETKPPAQGELPILQVLKEMPLPMPATPRPKPRTPWGLYAGGTAILVACGLTLGVLAQGTRSYAESSDVAATAKDTSTSEKSSEGARATRGAPVVLSAEQVLFSVEPLEAHVFQGDTDLGTGPFLVQVPAGQSLSLEARREGYKSQPVTLDGTEKRVGIKLVPVSTGAGTARGR